MALSHAILTALSGEPLSGYDLTKSFRTSTGYFWQASRQQIYAEIQRLADGGLIAGSKLEQDKLPDKIIWSITPEGIAELTDWLGRPSKVPSMKEELIVKLFALSRADLPAYLRQLEERRDHHRERVTLFTAIVEKLARAARGDLDAIGRRMGARAGVLYEQAMLDWCEETMATVASLARAEPPRD